MSSDDVQDKSIACARTQLGGHLVTAVFPRAGPLLLRDMDSTRMEVGMHLVARPGGSHDSADGDGEAEESEAWAEVIF